MPTAGHEGSRMLRHIAHSRDVTTPRTFHECHAIQRGVGVRSAIGALRPLVREQVGARLFVRNTYFR
jgi:hypothetical protein